MPSIRCTSTFKTNNQFFVPPRRTRNVILELIIAAAIMIAIITFSSSISFIQFASAIAPVAQITSVKSHGLDVEKNGIVLTHFGRTPAEVSIDFRGFGSSHIKEIRCSFDGLNYHISNCPMVSQETRKDLAGPDGITRTYYLKTGTVLREFPPRSDSYFFGIMVINAKQEKSLANWNFKILQGVMPEVQNLRAYQWHLSIGGAIDPTDIFGGGTDANDANVYVNDGGSIKAASGTNQVDLIFDYQGSSDDNILGFLCSFDGTSYEGYNCNNFSTERKISFTGPDGANREHYTMAGNAHHTFSASPNPHTFGVKVVTKNNLLSPPKIITFKVEDGPVPSPPPKEEALRKHVLELEDIRIYNTHEGALSGDGEYDLYIYVHGKLFSLTDLSRKSGGYGLRDVSKDETVKFAPGTKILVDVPVNIRLSVFTVGSEDDGCGKENYPPDIQDKILSMFKPIAKYNDIEGVFSDTAALRKIQVEIDKPKQCALNSDDNIANVVKVFDRGDYSLSGYTVLRSSDFMLRFKNYMTN